jgi:hypothetical protein
MPNRGALMNIALRLHEYKYLTLGSLQWATLVIETKIDLVKPA